MKICMDFDGVIHSFKTPWEGTDIIPDRPVPGCREALLSLKKMGYTIYVNSARCVCQKGREAIAQYMKMHDLYYDEVVEHKPVADFYVDDHALLFNGNWNELFAIASVSRLTNVDYLSSIKKKEIVLRSNRETVDNLSVLRLIKDKTAVSPKSLREYPLGDDHPKSKYKKLSVYFCNQYAVNNYQSLATYFNLSPDEIIQILLEMPPQLDMVEFAEMELFLENHFNTRCLYDMEKQSILPMGRRRPLRGKNLKKFIENKE